MAGTSLTEHLTDRKCTGQTPCCPTCWTCFMEVPVAPVGPPILRTSEPSPSPPHTKPLCPQCSFVTEFSHPRGEFSTPPRTWAELGLHKCRVLCGNRAPCFNYYRFSFFQGNAGPLSTPHCWLQRSCHDFGWASISLANLNIYAPAV